MKRKLLQYCTHCTKLLFSYYSIFRTAPYSSSILALSHLSHPKVYAQLLFLLQKNSSENFDSEPQFLLFSYISELVVSEKEDEMDHYLAGSLSRVAIKSRVLWYQ